MDRRGGGGGEKHEAKTKLKEGRAMTGKSGEYGAVGKERWMDERGGSELG